MLHSIFKRAVRDKLIVANPCEQTELPKVITRKGPTVTADEFDRLLAAIPERHRVMVETAIETGMRWGELIALRPRHIDFLRKTVTVEETIVEVSRKHSPTGERYVVKPYPKDNEPRTFGVDDDWLAKVAAPHPEPRAWTATSCSSRRPWGLPSRATRSGRAYGCRPWRPAASVSTSGCTTSGTRTPRGSSARART